MKKKVKLNTRMRGGGEIKFRFFNYRRIEWNLIIFCEKFSISPISNFNVNFDFQKWFTCWEDFRNFEEFFFVSPIVHQHVNLTMITYWRNDIFLNHFFKMLINFPHTWHQSTYQNQTVSYMSVNFTKKITFSDDVFLISPTCSSFFM